MRAERISVRTKNNMIAQEGDRTVGQIKRVICKACGYEATVTEGVGFQGFAYLEEQKQKILDGEIPCSDEVIGILREGGSLSCGAACLCPKCREIVSDGTIFCAAPDETGAKRIYPFGEPKCEKCSGELIPLGDIWSPEVVCPKCGGKLDRGVIIMYD